MKQYINKNNVTELSTVTPSDLTYFKISRDSVYKIAGETLTEAELCAKFNLKNSGGDTFYYDKPQILANNFSKTFDTVVDMEEWVTVNLPNMVFTNEVVVSNRIGEEVKAN